MDRADRRTPSMAAISRSLEALEVINVNVGVIKVL